MVRHRYVAQQHAAWHSFHARRPPPAPEPPGRLRPLAGLAPLQAERSTTKGGPTATALADPLTFYDTSSYGPRAVRAMATAVGIGQLVHGTDYPVHSRTEDPSSRPSATGFAKLVKTSAPNRALGYTWVPAAREVSA